MGKVFDALRRAEEERKGSPGIAAGAPADPLEAAEAVSGETAVDSPEIPGAPEQAAPPLVPSKRRGSIGRASVSIWEAFGAAWGWILRRGKPVVDERLADVKRRLIQFDPYSPASEQYRAIRTRIELLNEKGECCVLAVMSALPDEGKTMTAINLALVMGMSVDRRVLLIDCDLRTPHVHSALQLPMEPGLTDVLRGEVSVEKALNEIPRENLTVLPSGNLPTNPAELLATPQMRDTLQKLSSRFDHVIIDTPPALQVADSEIIGNLVDGIIFVVRAGSTPREQVTRALDNFERERIIGIVLNSAENQEAGDYGGES